MITPEYHAGDDRALAQHRGETIDDRPWNHCPRFLYDPHCAGDDTCHCFADGAPS